MSVYRDGVIAWLGETQDTIREAEIVFNLMANWLAAVISNCLQFEPGVLAKAVPIMFSGVTVYRGMSTIQFAEENWWFHGSDAISNLVFIINDFKVI